MKKLNNIVGGVILAALVGVAAYWNFHVYQLNQELSLVAAPFQEACQTATGCVSAPVGWNKETDSAGGIAYHNGEKPLNMAYTATQSDFKISWHIGTDVYLNATGGKGKQLKIVREVE